MQLTRRRNKPKPDGPETIAARLPDELKSFDQWYRPNGLSEYMRELSRFVGEDQRLTPVMSAAGLSAAQWFRTMLERGPDAGSGADPLGRAAAPSEAPHKAPAGPSGITPTPDNARSSACGPYRGQMEDA